MKISRVQRCYLEGHLHHDWDILFFFFFFSHWSIIALQCVRFCSPRKWISSFKHVPPPVWASLPVPIPAIWVITEHSSPYLSLEDHRFSAVLVSADRSMKQLHVSLCPETPSRPSPRSGRTEQHADLSVLRSSSRQPSVSHGGWGYQRPSLNSSRRLLLCCVHKSQTVLPILRLCDKEAEGLLDSRNS